MTRITAHRSEENNHMQRTYQSAANGPTWSFSRDQILRSCERKYFFQYASNASLSDPDPWLRGVALLKKLKNIPMWQGDCVHNSIAEYFGQLQQGKEFRFEQAARDLRQRMFRDWQFSQTRKFREEPASVGRFGAALFEHEYDEVPPETDAKELVEEAVGTLSAFFRWVDERPGFIADFKSAKRRWIEPPPWGTAAPGYVVEDVQVITKVDLALHLQDDRFKIYDWKTGAPPKNSMGGASYGTQVNVYMLWPHLTLKFPLEMVSGSLVYLGGQEPKEVSFQLDEEIAVETQAVIAESVEEAQRWEKHVNDGRLGLAQLDFASSVHECKKCNYKRICRAALTR
jgi:hypothetical protein